MTLDDTTIDWDALKDIAGGWRRLADDLGISVAQLTRLRKGTRKPSKTLVLLTKAYVANPWMVMGKSRYGDFERAKKALK